ncbi:MAG: serine dehydratase subunit alpha family protein [Caulobacteraceae bacterium]
MNREDILSILKQQVKPARGCTEPVAVALAVSTAYKEIKGTVEEIRVVLSPNIYKNGMRVGIPGTNEKGIVFAVALSIVCGNPELGLELFKNVNDCYVNEADKLVQENKISVEVEDDKDNFYIEAAIKTNKGKARCIVKSSHTNIVYLEANGKVIYNEEEKQCAFEEGYNVNKYALKNLSIKEIKAFIEDVPYADIEFLLDGVKLNINMANKGLESKIGLGAGMSQLLQKGILKDDIVNQVRILTSSACDARMAGINLPVMSSAGSGNHGITAIIPPTVVCRYLGYDDEKLARALALSHLITAYIKEYTGKLSPVCGCSVAAGIGASASIAWLLGGSYEQMVGAINNMVGAISGMVCDGAKCGCAYKLSTAGSEAVIQAYLAVNGTVISKFDGIVGDDAEATIRNLGILSNEGMKDMDNTILKILTNKAVQ